MQKGDNRSSLIDDGAREQFTAVKDSLPPALPEDRSTSGISPYLWNKAYDSIKEREPELVETYEKILSQQIVEGTPNRDIRVE